MRNICVFDHMHKLSYYYFTFVLEVESSFAYHQPSYHHFCTDVLYFHSIIKLYEMGKDTVPSTSIEPHWYFRFNAPIFFISSSQEIISWNWRMMAYLLQIHRAAIDPPLISFTQNRIKGLFHVNRKCVLSYHQNYWKFHSLQRIWNTGSSFSENRRVEITLSQRLKMTPK
jgi:hypothetical protein